MVPSSSGDVRMVPRTLSSGTMSSTEELDDKENTTVSFEHSESAALHAV